MSGPERPSRIRVGRIVRPHGLVGEVVVCGAALTPSELTGLEHVRLVRDD